MLNNANIPTTPGITPMYEYAELNDLEAAYLRDLELTRIGERFKKISESLTELINQLNATN